MFSPITMFAKMLFTSHFMLNFPQNWQEEFLPIDLKSFDFAIFTFSSRIYPLPQQVLALVDLHVHSSMLNYLFPVKE